MNITQYAVKLNHNLHFIQCKFCHVIFKLTGCVRQQMLSIRLCHSNNCIFTFYNVYTDTRLPLMQYMY